MADYIPNKDGDYISFIGVINDNIPVDGLTLGMTAAQITVLGNSIDAYEADHAATETAVATAAGKGAANVSSL